MTTSTPKQGTAKKSFKPAVSSESLAAAAELAEQQQQLLQQPPLTADKQTSQSAVKRRVEESQGSDNGFKKLRRDSMEDSGTTAFSANKGIVERFFFLQTNFCFRS